MPKAKRSADHKRWRRQNRGAALVQLATHRARQKGLDCTLDPVSIQAVIDAGECQMTGIPFNLDGGRTWDSPSIDRLDTSKGYTPENTRVVLYCINVMANTWGENKIVEIAEAIMARRRSRSAEFQQRLESALKQRLSSNSSPEFELIWKHWPMLSGPPICALRAAARRTSDNGSGGSHWPTPAARDHFPAHTPEYIAAKKTQGHGMSNLNDTVMLSAWPSPAARDWKGAPASMESFERNDNARPLNEVARLAGWPTPMAGSPGTETYNPAGNTDNSRKTVALVGWPTPTARDHFPAHTPEYIAEKKALGHGISNLNDQASGAAALASPAPTEKRGALDPAFSRWLMGYPPEWDACAATATRSSRKSRRSSSKPIAVEEMFA